MDNDWELRSHLLSMNEIEGRHTGETMAQDLFDTVAKMIGTEKVLGHTLSAILIDV
jgi:hypothetical protein